MYLHIYLYICKCIIFQFLEYIKLNLYNHKKLKKIFYTQLPLTSYMFSALHKHKPNWLSILFRKFSLLVIP